MLTFKQFLNEEINIHNFSQERERRISEIKKSLPDLKREVQERNSLIKSVGLMMTKLTNDKKSFSARELEPTFNDYVHAVNLLGPMFTFNSDLDHGIEANVDDDLVEKIMSCLEDSASKTNGIKEVRLDRSYKTIGSRRSKLGDRYVQIIYNKGSENIKLPKISDEEKILLTYEERTLIEEFGAFVYKLKTINVFLKNLEKNLKTIRK